MKKLITSLSCALVLSLSANSDLPITHENFEVSLSWLEEKPKSYAKDFFIIQYLKQNIIASDAKTAYDMARNKNGRVKKEFNKKFQDLPSEDLKCYRAKTNDLLKYDDRCLALGLSLYDSTTLSQKKLNSVIQRVEKYPTLRNDLKVIASDQPFFSLLSTEPHRFYRLFFKAGKAFRRNEINHPIPSSFIDKISKDKKFNRFTRYVVTNPRLVNLQKSLFKVANNKELTHQTLFFLAINAIKYDKDEVSLSYLKDAYKKAYFQMDKDKVNFWRYLITKDNSFLTPLLESWDNNIYSLYAKEISNTKSTSIEYDIDLLNKETSFDSLSQFDWIDVVRDTKKDLSEEKLNKYHNLFSNEEFLPQYTFVLERYKKYKTQYFITPFKDVFKKYDLDKQILMYSIGRQESRFIPSSVSTATAQGIMQIMPFLSKALAKQLKEPYNIYHQFIPEVNIKYASKHLNTLKKQFKNNPLFIAYAYNGGPGYTRKQFKNGLFKTLDKKYEPFLSMELISYNETRRYGKKVLANYYVYNNHMNKENSVKLSSIFQTLVAPK